MTSIKDRLRAKLLQQQMPPKEQLDAMIAREIADKMIDKKAKESTEEDYFRWSDGRELPVQSLFLDVLYDLIKRDPNIDNLTLEMKDGKKLILKWE